MFLPFISGACKDGEGVGRSAQEPPARCPLQTDESLVILLKAYNLLPNLGNKVWAYDNDIFHFYF